MGDLGTSLRVGPINRTGVWSSEFGVVLHEVVTPYWNASDSRMQSRCIPQCTQGLYC